MTSRRDDDDDDVPDRRRVRWLVGLAALLAVPLAVVYWPGCREYPPATSRESMSLMKLLYAACNTKDAARLAKVEEGVEKATREGKLSPPEQAAFAKIVGMAKAGDWAGGEKAAFKFAQDQVGRGSAETHTHDPHDHPHEKPSPKGTSKR